MGLHLNEARMLDKSINHALDKEEKPNQSGIGIIPTGDNELDKRRRENEKR